MICQNIICHHAQRTLTIDNRWTLKIHNHKGYDMHVPTYGTSRVDGGRAGGVWILGSWRSPKKTVSSLKLVAELGSFLRVCHFPKKNHHI
jgi:hypothetical protein